MKTLVLWVSLIINPFNIELKEKYGPTIEIDSVNIVIQRNGSLYITRNGDLYGVYPTSNYSVRRCE